MDDFLGAVEVSISDLFNLQPAAGLASTGVEHAAALPPHALFRECWLNLQGVWMGQVHLAVYVRPPQCGPLPLDLFVPRDALDMREYARSCGDYPDDDPVPIVAPADGLVPTPAGPACERLLDAAASDTLTALLAQPVRDKDMARQHIDAVRDWVRGRRRSTGEPVAGGAAVFVDAYFGTRLVALGSSGDVVLEQLVDDVTWRRAQDERLGVQWQALYMRQAAADLAYRSHSLPLLEDAAHGRGGPPTVGGAGGPVVSAAASDASRAPPGDGPSLMLFTATPFAHHRNPGMLKLCQLGIPNRTALPPLRQVEATCSDSAVVDSIAFYRIETTLLGSADAGSTDNTVTSVYWRRFSEFVELAKAIRKIAPDLRFAAALPSKTLPFRDTTSPSLRRSRVRKLNLWLDDVIADHPELLLEPTVAVFLGLPAAAPMAARGDTALRCRMWMVLSGAALLARDNPSPSYETLAAATSVESWVATGFAASLYRSCSRAFSDIDLDLSRTDPSVGPASRAVSCCCSAFTQAPLTRHPGPAACSSRICAVQPLSGILAGHVVCGLVLHASV